MDRLFQTWLRWIFDHPVRLDRASAPRNDWAATWDPEAEPAKTVALLTRLFREPRQLIAPYSPDQIGQGLWTLCDPSRSSHLLCLTDENIDWQDRKPAIDAIATLFSDLLAEICSESLGQQDSAPGKLTLANRLCYMFWDIAPLGPRQDERNPSASDLACLDVLRRILAIDHLACRESALHGFSHWAPAYPTLVADCLDAFLASSEDLTPAVRDYARRVREEIA